MRHPGPLLGAAFALGAGAAALGPRVAGVGRSWRQRVAVAGHSMEPTLRTGDWLLVDPGAFDQRPPSNGDLVVARDPRQRDRLITKRIAEVLPDGSLRLAADHPAHATDGELIGTIDPAFLVGRPWFRYWPLHRAGRLR